MSTYRYNTFAFMFITDKIMGDLNKFSIQCGEQGSQISTGINNQIEATDIELNKNLAEIDENFLVKNKREQYEALKPVGFEYASEKAKEYRKKLEDAKDIKQMQYLQKILAYNHDRKSIRLLDIDETFCSNLVGLQSMDWGSARYLANQEGYHLLSDSDSDSSEAERQTTDVYRLLNTFGEYAKSALFGMLNFDQGGCGYWMATKFDDKYALYRIFYGDGCSLCINNIKNHGYVCGFKKKST